MASVAGVAKPYQGIVRTPSGTGVETDSNRKPARPAAAAGSPVVVDLSARAKALSIGVSLAQPFKTPEEDIQERTDVLAGKLSDLLKRAGIPSDETISLKVDNFGHVTADGPYKKKIEAYFADNPDSKELRAIVEFRTLQATLQALEALAEEKKAARNDQDAEKANTRFLTRSSEIQRLDGQVTLQNGKLTTGAQDYITSLKVPTTADDIVARDQALDRLAAFA
jgi:hypothetical protein